MGGEEFEQPRQKFRFAGAFAAEVRDSPAWGHFGGSTQFDNFQLTASTPEPGLSGWTIYLDQNDNGRRDPDEAFTVTDADGNYAFANLPAGRYVVREEQQRGWTRTFPSADPSSADGYADVILDLDYPSVTKEQVSVVLGSPDDGFASFTQGTSITVGFVDESIVDGPRKDLWVHGLYFSSAGEQAEVYVSANGRDFTFLGIASEGDVAGMDLADVGFTAPVTAIKFVALDSLGSFPGFDLFSFDVLHRGPGSDGHVVVLRNGQTASGIDFGNQRTPDGAANRSPVITSTAPVAAVVGQPLRYDFIANDADQDPLVYDLVTRPVGMALDGTTIVWTPTPDQVGRNDVVLRVRDDHGGITLQSFTVVVSNPIPPPSSSPRRRRLPASLARTLTRSSPRTPTAIRSPSASIDLPLA